MALTATDGSQRFFTEHPNQQRWGGATPQLPWKSPTANGGGSKKLILPELSSTPTEQWGASFQRAGHPNSTLVKLNDQLIHYSLNKTDLEAWADRVGVRDEYNTASADGSVTDLTEVVYHASLKTQPLARRAAETTCSSTSKALATRPFTLQVVTGVAVAVSAVALFAVNSPYIQSFFVEEVVEPPPPPPTADSLWQVDSWDTAQEYWRS